MKVNISVPQAALVSHLLDSVLGLTQCKDSKQPVITTVLSNLSQVVRVAALYASQRRPGPRAPDNNRSIRSEEPGARQKSESGPGEDISFFLSASTSQTSRSPVCLART